MATLSAFFTWLGEVVLHLVQMLATAVLRHLMTAAYVQA